MNKILVIVKNEVITLLSRSSFWLATLGLPLVATLIFGVLGGLSRNQEASQAVNQVVFGPQEMRPEGYVDLAGILQQVPSDLPAGLFLPFPDEEAAQQALEAGEIQAYYVIPADYLKRGLIHYVMPEPNLFWVARVREGPFDWMLRVNLASGDPLLARLVEGPLEVEEVSLVPVVVSNDENLLLIWVPYIVTLLYFILIIGTATLLVNGLSKEKENRVLEILLTSASPHQFLAGKIVALGAVGLFQTILWGGTTWVLLNRSGQTFNLPSEIRLPPEFLAWGVVFFLLGYAVYASLMAGIGALAPNLRESSQVSLLVLFPLMVPLIFSNTVFAEDPHGVLATGLSLFPLSAPVAMMARLAVGGVVWWQPPLAALLLALTAVLIVRAVARVFRAQVMFSGQPLSIPRYLWALFGKM